MQHLSLRLRVFLFFALLGIGGCGIVLGALYVGYRQLAVSDPLSAFVTIATISVLGLIALATLVWRLFDENVSKPVERVAARCRLGANGLGLPDIDPEDARYLGDLAPATAAMQKRLDDAVRKAADMVTQKTAQLDMQRAQLLRILSDIPVAVIVATDAHQIVLYDGQAADLIEREAPARLNGTVFDYFQPEAITDALGHLRDTQTPRQAIAITGRSGAVYTGHIRRFRTGTDYTLMLEPLDPDAERPLVYDFDLLTASPPTHLEKAPLHDLTFVVFDSETTGLDPKRDDVVQLGAVRVVNGKIVPGEVFDTLVNPGRPIPPSSSKVHGIDDVMVASAPDFANARTAFQAFAKGAVLVAHNAPFDMAFLHRGADRTAPPFDNPVLDTVHLSAMVFGGSADHTLDALCQRLQITIPTGLRHTALGDACATAEVLVALMPILRSRGFETFGQVRAEAKRHARILEVLD